uniref:Acyltransferase n=1 Tax=Aureoumbra lagunensis TaxID=44058 RepID=A0A7S3JR52_9STRA|mmetsp:Transcript_9153/g.14104  ORF Transcript_9153/g.14104 Transcript_9153/m.14104 type:complete len:346 (+) Transcript_9153:38-1075(+)
MDNVAVHQSRLKEEENLVVSGIQETILSSYPKLHTLLVCVAFHLVYLILPLLTTVFPFLLLFRNEGKLSRTCGFVLIVGWCSQINGVEKKLGKVMPWICEWGFWKYLFSWFPITIERKKELDPRRTYIFGVHPHGAIAFNRAAYGFDERNLWQKAFPGIDYRVLTATAAFCVPVIRELWLWTRCVSADKLTARRVLAAKKSIVIFIGGEREQILSQRGKHILYLKKRKGFVKLAIETKSPLIPIYAFGEVDLYHHYNFLLSFRTYLVNTFGIAIPLISGSIFLLPYKTPLHIIVGEPIEPPSSPSDIIDDDMINQLHSRYMIALQSLFDENKARCGYPNAQLIIT